MQREAVTENLARFERVAASTDGLKAAAVAVCVVVQDDGTLALLITLRADTLRSHAGQWALPGGRRESGESAEDAARLSEVRFKAGTTDYLEVLTNETNSLTAELGLAQARGNELIAMVQVYQALGGGWQ